MKKLNRETLFSPSGIFFLYIFVSSLVIMCFRWIFPGEGPPLGYFNFTWRLVQGGKSLIDLFPALALSALVIPFGLRAHPPQNFSSFSPNFLKNLSPLIFSAIAAAGIYAFLFILVQPLILNHEANLRAQARLWRLSSEQARYQAARGNWLDVYRFVAICDNIWPDSPEMSDLKDETYVQTQYITLRGLPRPERDRPITWRDLAGAQPLTSTGAILLAEAAMEEERFYDAHWLATVAAELAGPGSAETARAVLIAAEAWNAANSLEPNSEQLEAFAVFHLKRRAYMALDSGDFLSSYYLFQELINQAPRDAEAAHFLSLSEQGLASMAFFIDEMNLREYPQGATISLPQADGRLVMNFSSLSVYPDSAYGFGMEILSFDQAGRLIWSLTAPYAKILPLSQGERGRITVLMRALDRYDEAYRYEPLIQNFGGNTPENALLILDMNLNDFQLIAGLRRGKDNLNIGELITASRIAHDYGHLPEVFEAELISRFTEPVLFLPILVLILIFGWRFRAIRKPRFIWIPLLGVLPLVFSGVVHFIRNVLSNFSVWSVIYLGFPFTIILVSIVTLALYIFSLIALASQRG